MGDEKVAALTLPLALIDGVVGGISDLHNVLGGQQKKRRKAEAGGKQTARSISRAPPSTTWKMRPMLAPASAFSRKQLSLLASTRKNVAETLTLKRHSTTATTDTTFACCVIAKKKKKRKENRNFLFFILIEKMIVVERLVEEDKDEWLDFVASVFESAGRQYFLDHLDNDPLVDYSKILVARDEATKAIGLWEKKRKVTGVC